jgi:periplasmic divalent cation tolerance protein
VPENYAGVNEGSPSGTATRPDAILIYATFPTPEVAECIGSELVALRLAACVNLIPGQLSIYRWQGAIHRDAEVGAFIKTRVGLMERVVGAVRILHPYVNPALVVLPTGGGSADFLAWIAAETSSSC